MRRHVKKKKGFTLIGPKDHDLIDKLRRDSKTAAFTLIKPKAYDRNEVSGREQTYKTAFTLIELIVVMAVIGILVLLAAPKFLGYAERAQETKHIHAAKVIETALEAYLINGGIFPEDLEIVDETTLNEAVNNKSLYGVNGLIGSPDGEIYYEITHDFIKKLDVKLYATNELFVEAMASSVPTAVYASEKGITLIDKAKTLKGYELKPGELPNEINPDELINLFIGDGHSLVLKEDGTIWAWGNNTLGQLGIGNKINQLAPQEITSLRDKNIQSIVAGGSHTFAISGSGEVWAWGFNDYGQLGIGNRVTQVIPQRVFSLDAKNIKSIHAGTYHSLAFGHDGTIWTWGMNRYGELGLGTTTYEFTTPQKHMFFEDKDIQYIKVDGRNNIAKDGTGKIWIWGVNSYGALGLGHMNTVFTPQELLFPENIEVKSIIVAKNSIFAITSDDSVWAWGDNSQGKLGLGDTINRNRPTRVTSLDDKNIQSIVSGWGHTLAIEQNGKVWAWGYNAFGQLGLGHTITKTNESPQEIVLLADKRIQKLFVSNDSSIAISVDNTMWVWGNNSNGQLGDGTTINRLTPTLITIE